MLDFGLTVLMSAAANEHLAIVERLLHQGATLDARDGNNWTALIWAAEGGQKVVVDALKQARQAG